MKIGKNNNFILVIFSNSIADSPLLQVPGGTKKTERRRSRSRNRQEIESELARKLNEIPMVHDTIEYLLSSYSLIKVFNQINFYYVRWETERIWWWFGTNVVCQTFFSQIVISLNHFREKSRFQGKAKEIFQIP